MVARFREQHEVKPQEDIASHNLKVYRGRLLSWWFQRRTELLAPEASILRELGSGFSNAKILDIGVGGGRTTAHLVQLSAHYTGIDSSPRMIARCKARFPTLSFKICDARDLSQFRDGCFDLVLFSFNGIDSVSHPERLKVLREIKRVLSKGGAFVFSSHNRDFADAARPWDATLLFKESPLSNPLKFLARIVCYPIGIKNYLLNRKREWQAEEYAIRNDLANNYQMLFYCISVKRQIAQLETAGYSGIDVVGVDGRWLPPLENDECRQDPFLYYVCRT